jgi:hypothetical protein
MRPIRFEAADASERTQIGEGLTRVAVRAGRLETGREGGKYFLSHGDGCGVCGRGVAAGDAFYLDPETGEVLCERHGRDRREAVERGARDSAPTADDADTVRGTGGAVARDPDADAAGDVDA